MVLVVGLVGVAVVAASLSGAASIPRVARYGVFERSLMFRTSFSNPWEQVTEDVTLAGPGGRRVVIDGFFEGGSRWAFRFAPFLLGRWSWVATIRDALHRVTKEGSFLVVPGGTGFVRQSRGNLYRWTFSNGQPYDAIGLQDCTVTVYTTNPLTGFGFDGEGGTPRWTSLEPYLSAYQAAGFNLFRWGPDNCSFGLYDKIDPGGNVYSLQGGDYADELMQALRRHGFRVEFVLFGFNPPFPSGSSDGAKMAAVERYVRYVTARYGAYVDFWELMNEATVSDGWYTTIGTFLHRIDPYQHPIATSWSRPDLPVIDFGSDHWYQTEPELDSDQVTWQRLRAEPARQYGKPTIVDEQGNTGTNWDPSSAIRMRLRAWTAFFAEATLVFWNTSAIKDHTADSANIYLGPQERSYIHILAQYMRGFDPAAQVVTAPATGTDGLRSYALRGPHEYGLYLVDGTSHTTPVSGAHVTVSPAHAGHAIWTNPNTGQTLATQNVSAGTQTLTVPTFTTDVALKIS